MTRITYPAAVPDTLPRADQWSKQGTCAKPEYRHRVDELWFAATTQSAAVAEAKQICAACPVRAACLADAMEMEGGSSLDRRHGIRGGLTHWERLSRYRKQRAAA